MARTPPPRKRKNTPGEGRGPIETKHLPDKPDAKRTWTGPPYERSPRRWSGTMDFGGTKHNVGTFDTPRQWGKARDELLVELRKAKEPVEVPPKRRLEGLTINQFIADYNWPHGFKRKGKRSQPSTFNHHEQCIRAFTAQFGERLIEDGIDSHDASTWADDATENQVTSAIALFNDARSVDARLFNPLGGMSRTRTRGREDLPDVLNVEEVELLKSLTAHVFSDEYRMFVVAMIEIMATSAPRPGELWAFERRRLNAEQSEIWIESAVKKGGKLGPPKYNQKRWCVLAPSALDLLLALPVVDERFFFVSKLGRLMSQTNWTTYWHPLRDVFAAMLPENHWLRLRITTCAEARAAEPDPEKRKRMADGKLDFYELRHRGCTFMAEPPPHGLGLSAPDIAIQVGHTDGGRLVEKLYIHRNKEHARARVRAAMGTVPR